MKNRLLARFLVDNSNMYYVLNNAYTDAYHLSYINIKQQLVICMILQQSMFTGLLTVLAQTANTIMLVSWQEPLLLVNVYYLHNLAVVSQKSAIILVHIIGTEAAVECNVHDMDMNTTIYKNWG